LQTYTILLVDDDEDDYLIMSLFCKEIENCQICLIWAGTYAEAQRYIVQYTPDMLIVDYHLNSSRTGLDLVVEFKEKHPHLPAILVSAHDKDNIRSARSFSILDGYIHKNEISSKVLAETICPFLI
jgi:response regulator of citrate/malate metabolism